MPTTTIRYDEKTRDEIMPLLESMGISLNTYMNMALHQLAIQKRIPFRIYGTSRSEADAPMFAEIPVMKKRNGKLIAPADWYDEDDDE